MGRSLVARGALERSRAREEQRKQRQRAEGRELACIHGAGGADRCSHAHGGPFPLRRRVRLRPMRDAAQLELFQPTNVGVPSRAMTSFARRRDRHCAC